MFLFSKEGSVKIYVEEKGEIRRLEYDLPIVQIGRARDNQLVIRDPRSSRHHCRILSTPDGHFLEDLGSRNGTSMKGARITRELLHEGDGFQIGSTRFFFERLPEAQPVVESAAGEESPPSPDAAIAATEVERPAIAVAPSAALTPIDVYLEGLTGSCAGKRIPITKIPYTIGRKADNDFRVEDRKASSHHARVVRGGEIFFIEDLESRNGTFVNGRRVERCPLVPGARLQIGDSQFRVQVPVVEGVDLEQFLGPAEVAGADVVGEEDFSRFRPRDLLETDRSRQPVLLAGILVIFGTILFLTVQITLQRLRRAQPDPSPPAAGNRIVLNWSFEDDPLPDGRIPGWRLLDEATGTLTLSAEEGVQWPGLRALEVNPAADASGLVEAVWAGAEGDPGILIEPETPYYLAGHVLNRGGLAAGLVVTWLGEGDDGILEISRSYSGTLRAAGDRDDVVRKVIPPPAATRARVGCFALAPGGGAAFDRVFFGVQPPPWLAPDLAGEDASKPPEEAPPREASGFDTPLELVAAPVMQADGEGLPIRLELEPDGRLAQIRRGRLPLVAALYPGLPPSRDPLALGLRPGDLAISRRSDRVGFTSQVPDLQGDWHPLEGQILIAGTDLICRFRFQKGRNTERLPGRVALYLEISAAEKERSAFGDAAPGEAGREGLSEGRAPSFPVRELVLGGGTEQLVLRFTPPLEFEFLAAGNGRPRPLVVGVASPEGEKSRDLEVRMTHSSRQEEIVLQRFFLAAERLQKEGDHAGALARLAAVEEAYPWQSDALARAKTLRANWLEQAHSAIAGVETELRLLESISSVVIHDALLGRLSGLRERYRGVTEVEKKLDEVERRVRSLWQARGIATPRVQHLLERGREFFEKKENHLALLYLREARRLGAKDTTVVSEVDRLLGLIDLRRRGAASRAGPQ